MIVYFSFNDYIQVNLVMKTFEKSFIQVKVISEIGIV